MQDAIGTNNHSIELIDTHEAAKRLGFSSDTLRRWRSQKQGPPFRRLGSKSIRYNSTEIDLWSRRGESAVNNELD